MKSNSVMLIARPLARGSGRGELVVLDEPLSFWGGFDASAGTISDPRHPQSGTHLADKVLALPSGRGSSSSSAVLAEAIRAGSSPVAIVLLERDMIIALGSIVADELYGRCCPVVQVGPADFATLASGNITEVAVVVEGDAARVVLTPGS